MSLGTERVRLSVNPGSNPDVDSIKQRIADCIDLVETCREDILANDASVSNAEVNRLAALAQTALEDAAMWAVKLATTGK